MTGYDRTELVGRNCRLLQGPGTDLSVIRQVRAAVRNGTACTAELLNYKRDGSAFVNLLHFAPVRDPTGAIAYFVGVQSDLTALRERATADAAAAQVAQAANVPLPADVRGVAASLDSALSSHLREILKSSMLMQTLG
jgi:PAS domain S-box-containing protein